MYCQHFGFTHYPFETTIAADALFASTTLNEARVRLKHLLELRSIGLITGESGCGKTTACRQFAEQLHPGLYRLIYVSLTTGSVMDLYKTIAWELGLPTTLNRAMAFRAIRAEITRLTLETRQS